MAGGVLGGLRLLLALDALPFHENGSDQRQTRHAHADNEDLSQRMVVDEENFVQVLRWNHLSEFSGTGVDDVFRREIGDLADDSLDEIGVEHVLTDRYKNGAAELLEEKHQRDAGGDIFAFENGLGGHLRLLHAAADAETDEDLIPDPFAAAGVEIPCSDQPGADRHQHGRQKHVGSIQSQKTDELTSDDGADNEAEDERDGTYTGFDGADILGRKY